MVILSVRFLDKRESYRTKFWVGEAVGEKVESDGDEEHEDEGEAKGSGGYLHQPQHHQHDQLDSGEGMHLPGADLLDIGYVGVVLDGHEHKEESLQELYSCSRGHSHVQEDAKQNGFGHKVEHG